ncbi:MAG TPA: diacylglycerol kinase [Gammaproteobacteria bacterium]|nr:diacylglycerol kinase [Gammaproteobacteria bacterium]
MSPYYGARGFRHLGRAFGYSVAGFRSAVRHEAAFRQELLLCLLLAPAALWLGDDALERALLLASLMGVLVTELLNSAVEAAVDRMGEEFHPMAGRAKDLGSAAVFMALLVVAVVWGLIALPELVGRL